MLTLIVFNFKIFYRFNKINSTNELSKRFNYEKISLNKTTLLSMLQNKLTLSNINNLLFSISQNKRKNSNNLNFKLISILISNVIKIINNKTLSQNIKKQLQINFALIF